MNNHAKMEHDVPGNVICKYYKIIIFFLALFSAIAVIMDYSIVTDQNIIAITNPLIRFMESVTFSLKGSYVMGIIVFFAIFWLYWSINKIKSTRRTYVVTLIVSFLMAMVVVVGMSFAGTNSADLIFYDGVQVTKTIILLIGYWALFAAVTLWLFSLIDKYDIVEEATVTKLSSYFKKHVFCISIMVIVVCWLPRIISVYPGIFMGDTQYQLRQVFGDSPLSILHPIVHTLLFGAILKPIQSFTGSYNVAIYVYTLLQCSFTILVLAETVRRVTNYLNKLIVPCLMLVGYCVIPVFSAYSVTLTKDSLWAPILVLWMMEFMRLLDKGEEYTGFIKFFILALLVTLFRNNGVYVIVGTMLVLSIALKKHRKKMIISMMGIILIWVGMNKFCVNVLGIQGGSSGEMLSVPFQQTARYVKEYPDEVTEQEREAIDKVLDYSTLAQNYNPVSADPVKATYKTDCKKAELTAYMKTWWSMFLKHPGIYVDAFINNTYGYFYFSQTPVIYSGKLSEACIENTNKLSDVFNFSHSHAGWMEAMRELYDKYFYLVGSIPLLGILLTTAVWQWVMVFMVAYLILKRKWRYVLAYIPLFILLLTNVAGPINGSYYYRYEYPIAFTVPYLVFFTVAMCKKKDRKGEQTDESISDCASV